MAGPKTLNLIIYQGEKPYSVDLTFAGYNFTGCSGRAQVKDRSGNLLFQLAVTFPAPDKCRISYADTTLLAAARGAAWDLFITYSDGTIRPEVRGFAYVLEPGTIAPKSCNDAAASGFAVVITAAQQGPPGPPGTGGAGTANIYRLLYQPNGIYTLSPPPANPSSILLFVNGAKQVHSIDFNVNDALLNWVSALSLAANDIIEAIY